MDWTSQSCHSKDMEVNSPTTTFELIALLKTRPLMFLGDAKISSLYHFLHGFTFARSTAIQNFSQPFSPFWYFHEWVMEVYGWKEKESSALYENADRILLVEHSYGFLRRGIRPCPTVFYGEAQGHALRFFRRGIRPCPTVFAARHKATPYGFCGEAKATR